jgi:hypothetical protein
VNAVLLLASTAETERELPMPPLAFGLSALAVFAVLLAVTWAFRNVGNRH